MILTAPTPSNLSTWSQAKTTQQQKDKEALQEPPSFNWGKHRKHQKKKEQTEEIEINENEDSKLGVEIRLRDLPHKKLIACPKKATISAKLKGSEPKSGDNKSHLLISDEEASTLDDSCHYAGSSGELSEESEDGTDIG
jgi:hypothetical protein